MSGNCNTTLPTDDLAKLFQAAEVTIQAINGTGQPVRTDPGALKVAGENLACSLEMAKEAVWRSISRPVPSPVFETFVDNFGEING